MALKLDRYKERIKVKVSDGSLLRKLIGIFASLHSIRVVIYSFSDNRSTRHPDRPDTVEVKSARSRPGQIKFAACDIRASINHASGD